MMGNGVELPGLPVAVRAHAARRCQIKIHPQKPTTLAGGNPEKGIATLIVSESSKTRWIFFPKNCNKNIVKMNENEGFWMDYECFMCFSPPNFFWGRNFMIESGRPTGCESPPGTKLDDFPIFPQAYLNLRLQHLMIWEILCGC